MTAAHHPTAGPFFQGSQLANATSERRRRRGLPEKLDAPDRSRSLAAGAAAGEPDPRARSVEKRAPSGKAPGHPSHGVSGVLAALFRSFARLFFSNIRLERDGKNLHVKLATKGADTQAPAPIDPALAEVQPLRVALKTLLDSHPMTRRVMRHLTFFEGALAAHGLKAMAEVPIEVLSVAREQLEALVSNWSNPALAELRSKMAVAILDRSLDPFYGSTGQRLSDFNTHSRLVVGDASHSMFLELERQYQGVLPAQSIEAVLDPLRVEFAADAPSASGR